MGNNPYDYENRAAIRPISWEAFHGLCKGLVVALSCFRPEIILPIGRGGYYPGTLISHMLQVEIYPIRLSRREKDNVTYQSPRWLVEPPPAVRGRRSTGETLTMVKLKAKAMGAQDIRSAVLYAHTKGAAVPDYAGLISDDLILNPWDREIFADGTFRFHPEYAEAISRLGAKPDESLLIDAPIMEISKRS